MKCHRTCKRLSTNIFHIMEKVLFLLNCEFPKYITKLFPSVYISQQISSVLSYSDMSNYRNRITHKTFFDLKATFLAK